MRWRFKGVAPRLAAGLAALGLVGGLAGCKRQPTFEERYDAAHAQIMQTAGQIDAQISGSPAPVDSDAPE